MPRRSCVLSVATAFLLLVAGAGCSGEEVNSERTASGSPGNVDPGRLRDASQDDLAAVLTAPEQTETAGTLRYEATQRLALTASAEEQEGLTRTGALDFERGLHEQVITGPGTPGEIRFFYDGDSVLIRRPGGRWEEITDAVAEVPFGGVEQGQEVVLPGVDVLRTATLPGAVLEPGEQEATRLRVHVTEFESLSLLAPSTIQQVFDAVGEEDLVAEFDGKLDAEVGLDEQGRLRTFVVDLAPLLAHVGDVVPTLELPDDIARFTHSLRAFDHGAAVNLTAPDPKEIVPFGSADDG